ncbi:methyl-accepting chemotaxis protein [Bradyrhizobium sp. URHD0069]|uniref:methyl-accepting chemotaxis protein n=1 Tax=Bradyrhizobium sp. URHD0069 TaxID=1380355 RepID=UPI0004979091|nr:methyl-accepting chemotaxis protein [Bradyrhizobium sp. URHD0069]
MKTATSWYHLGLCGRLFTAFGVVAALTVLASCSAIISYDILGRSLGAIADKSLPEITRASKVVKAAGEVAAAAPRLLAATDAAERERASKVLTAARQELTGAIGALGAEDAARLNQTADRILVNLDRLMQSVAERQSIAASREALVANLRRSHQKLAEKLSPMADDAGFTLTIGLQTAADKKDLEVVQKTLAALADNELVALQAILDLRAESNLLLGILVEAADLPSADLLPPVKDRFTATAGRLAKAAAAFKDGETSKLIDDLVKTGKSTGNVFDLKQNELLAEKTGAGVVMENRTLAQEFEKEVGSLEARSEAAAASAVRSSEAEIRQGRIVLIALALASLATALIIGWYYVGRGVVRRLVRLQSSMKSIASGDLGAEIATGGSDEIADMAAALQVFKDNMVESNRLRAERADAETQAHAQRRVEMRKLADEFEAAVGEIVQTVSLASTELEKSAGTLTRTAEETEQLSGMVEAASGEASTNVRSVAAATEEMTASISEISRQVQESNRIAGEAVDQAQVTDTRINELSKAALRIGDVVNLITTIAEQTNLLALNATIEAARAGDSGRGFAVVAQEVKALAAQTAKATNEISSQIAGMQVATQDSVVAIKQIGTTIGRISEIAAMIATSVGQQGAATEEIAHNVEQAAQGTSQVAVNIVDVNKGARETGSASAKVLASAQSLSGESNRLKLEVGKFLDSVRAA